MIKMYFRDYVSIILKTLILTLIFAPLLIGAFYLMNSNVNFAYYISDVLDIPRNLSLTVMSAGFANNIIILMTVFEFGFAIWLGNKITKTELYDNVKKFVINLQVIVLSILVFCGKIILINPN